MANAKNTIQNIPLNGLLNLNTLKTDVKQFQGFNEKNSTVYGGELAPLYKVADPPLIGSMYTRPYKFIENPETEDFRVIHGSHNALIKLDADSSVKGIYICKKHINSDRTDLIEFRVYSNGKIAYRVANNTSNNSNIQQVYNLMPSTFTDVANTTVPSFEVEEVYFSVKPNNSNNLYRILIARISTTGDVAVSTVDYTNFSSVTTVGSDYIYINGRNSNTTVVKVYQGYPYSGNYNGWGGLGVDTLLINNTLHYFFQVITNAGLHTSDELNAIKNATGSSYNLPAVTEYLMDESTWTIIQTTTTFSSTNGNSGDIIYPVYRQMGNLAQGLHEDKLFTYNTVFSGKTDEKNIFKNTIIPLHAITQTVNISGGGGSTTYDFFGLDSYQYPAGTTKTSREMSVELYQFTGRALCAAPKIRSNKIDIATSFEDNFGIYFGDCYNDYTHHGKMDNFIITGHLNSILPSPMKYQFTSNTSWDISRRASLILDNYGLTISYLNGKVFSIVGSNGWNLCEPGTIIGNNLSPTYYDSDYFITFKTSSGWVFWYNGLDFPDSDPISFNNRYTLDLRSETTDLFTDKPATIFRNIGYVDTSIPAVYNYAKNATAKYTSSGSTYVIPVPCNFEGELPLTGAIYGGGFNVLYNLSDIELTGFTPNPYVISNFPEFDKWLDHQNSGRLDFPYDFNSAADLFDKYYIQNFFSYGDQVRTAKYYGKYDTFNDINYPIDTNGNTILPISIDSILIDGYMNNNMVTNSISGNSYPIIYYNNNKFVYAYFFLSMLSNVKGVFVIQSMHYAFDDNNIYGLQYQNGLLTASSTVAYKKNMYYLGALPNKAIFYSYFNKTFYAFMGDSSLYKLMEASDINEIYSVSQNPATLSLWICTDSGIYIISDTDMFKLDIITDVSKVYFHDDHFNVATKKWNSMTSRTDIYKDSIYLYNKDGNKEIIPLKFKTSFYGLGGEQKANYDCWYLRLHSANKLPGYVDLKVNTITDTSMETEIKRFDIGKSSYDDNGIVYLKYQPKYQSAVASQLELESNLALYQLSLGVNANDAVAQASHNNM